MSKMNEHAKIKSTKEGGPTIQNRTYKIATKGKLVTNKRQAFCLGKRTFH